MEIHVTTCVRLSALCSNLLHSAENELDLFKRGVLLTAYGWLWGKKRKVLLC